MQYRQVERTWQKAIWLGHEIKGKLRSSNFWWVLVPFIQIKHQMGFKVNTRGWKELGRGGHLELTFRLDRKHPVRYVE